MSIPAFCTRFAIVAALIYTGPATARAEEGKAEIVIAAASDLKFALDEVIAEFEKQEPRFVGKPTYGSSGNFFAQIDNGAPFDLFLSADVKFPQQLVERKNAVQESLFLYAVGRLVVWVPRTSQIDVEKRGADALRDPSIRKIAIANPEHAPYGAAAVAALKKLGLHDEVQGKFVLGENIAQTAQFVESGAADIGIIALSLATAPKMKSEGRYWEIPLDAFPRLEQGGVVLAGAKQKEGAELLRKMITSPRGHEILQRYGFILPDEKK
ncbi:MAG: molybdate ABC transporter substrate-binding protein [Chthoniobacterales bacterium]|nr:molybdate ABC transporter substrate-binding protein [Chthoniobacterales bacterium]